MKGKIIATLLALVMVVSSALVGCAAPAPTAPGEALIVNDYPDLKPLVDFVGEENLSVLNLVGFRAADRAMKDLSLSRGTSDVLALTDAGGLGNLSCLVVTWLAIGGHTGIWIPLEFAPSLILGAIVSGSVGVLLARGISRMIKSN